MSRMLQRRVFQTKSTMVLAGPAFLNVSSVSRSSLILSFAANILPYSFPDQWLLTSILVQQPEESFPEFPKQCPSQNSQGSWGQHYQHTCHRTAPQASPPQRKGEEAPSASTVSISQANNFLQTDPKLRGPTGSRKLPANKAPVLSITLWMKGFLVRNRKRKSKVWLWRSNPHPATWPWPNLLTFLSLFPCF